jgi:Arc/MetJ family transcription regulator
MRTTLDLPEKLVTEAQHITHLKTKTDVIIYALESLVKSSKLNRIKDYKGKIKLNIDLEALRKR